MESILYVGMDVHSTNFTVCTYSISEDKEFGLAQFKPDHMNIIHDVSLGTVLFDNQLSIIHDASSI